MYAPHYTKEQHIAELRAMSEEDFARLRYVHEMAGTYLAVGQFEDTLISAMLMCDRIKVRNKLGDDAKKWDELLAKRETLQGSTLGSLVVILQSHQIDINDINHLKWIKGKRDYFVHRLFRDGAWPGDLDEGGCLFMIRRLLALQLILGRANRNIWKILERAGLIDILPIQDGGFLAMNVDLEKIINGTDGL